MLMARRSLALLLMGGALCNDVILQPIGEGTAKLRAVGDPTEGALVVAAAHFGLLKHRLDAAFPRTDELPFDSDRKRMSTVHKVEDCSLWIGNCSDLAPGRTVVFAKGAVDSLLEVCTGVWDGGGTRSLSTRAIAAAFSTPTWISRGTGCACLGWRFEC
jgi:Ca2+-transporting ATPase